MKRRLLLFTAIFSIGITAADRDTRGPRVTAVQSVGMTVSDLDRSVEFYTKVLSFEKTSETEIAGDEYEHLEGVFGMRARVARLRLGDETLDLTEYLAPTGLPIPADFRSN